MKVLLLIPFLSLAVLSMAACGGSDEETLPSIQPTPTQPDEDEESGTATSMKMNIIVGDRTITATMEDNAAAQDFLSRLPLEVMLNDFKTIRQRKYFIPILH